MFVCWYLTQTGGAEYTQLETSLTTHIHTLGLVDTKPIATMFKQPPSANSAGSLVLCWLMPYAVSGGTRTYKREGCPSPRYYDPELGVFKYCSPQCRNEHYLPRYDRKVKDSLGQSKERDLVDDPLESSSSSTLRRSSSLSSILSFTLPASACYQSPVCTHGIWMSWEQGRRRGQST